MLPCANVDAYLVCPVEVDASLQARMWYNKTCTLDTEGVPKQPFGSLDSMGMRLLLICTGYRGMAR